MITKPDREDILRQALVKIADTLAKATEADDDERSLLFHVSLIQKIARDAVFKNETARKLYRDQ